MLPAMNAISKLAIVASVLLPCGDLAAETFKCTDASGKITYTSMKCSELGLKDAGAIRDRLNVQPAYRPPARENESRRPPPRSAPTAAPASEAPAAAAEPANPERRCFTVRTPTGNVTRCNDRPPE